MILLRQILVALVAFALAGYVVDCAPMASSDEAMQCCETMPCSSQSAEHSQNCCETMPSMHAPFVQAAATHGLSLFAGRSFDAASFARNCRPRFFHDLR